MLNTRRHAWVPGLAKQMGGHEALRPASDKNAMVRGAARRLRL